jgi:hypothetical protein
MLFFIQKAFCEKKYEKNLALLHVAVTGQDTNIKFMRLPAIPLFHPCQTGVC